MDLRITVLALGRRVLGSSRSLSARNVDLFLAVGWTPFTSSPLRRGFIAEGPVQRPNLSDSAAGGDGNDFRMLESNLLHLRYPLFFVALSSATNDSMQLWQNTWPH